MTALLADSHCHLDRLDLSPFDDELDGALELAAEHGVGYLLCVCINMENFAAVLDIARRHPNILASVGVHPNDTDGHEPDVDELVRLADDPKICAIGETGLDYFRSEGDLEWQRQRFRNHIEAAKRAGKPLIVHSREAREDTMRILEEERAGETGGVMHCFVEDWDTAQRAMDLGFYISFSGIVTFNSAKALRDVAKRVPLERMLVETDSPYLAPVPHRGRSNQPAYVRHVAEFIAKLRDMDVDVLINQTTANYRQLFSVGD